jgi:hypothetical protein
MLEREWISIRNPEDPHDRYVFDVSFLLSAYSCIYGQGCPGTDGRAADDRGCCRLGAHYIDDDDRVRTEAMVDVLGPTYLQRYADAKRRGITAHLAGGEQRTRVVAGACIFLNRDGWHRGAGCALHQYAWDRGEHHMTYKPEVCWIVPLRREVEQTTDDDGEELWTTTITSYDRGAWGPGGADFDWWCTDSPEAYGGTRPVYLSMEAELREMVGDAVYDELAAYLADRRGRARKPLPFPVFVR